MLRPLCDFFLLLSNDGKSITNKDLSIFYSFIIKKIPQLEQQYPNLILKSLIKTNEEPSYKWYERNKQIYLNTLKNNNESKKIIFYFQKRLLNLFNNLIYFFYKEGIIKLNNNIENKIKEKINEIYKSNGNDKKEIENKKIEQIRNLLIILTIKGFINYNINPSNFIDFFNGENKFQSRYWVVQFMNYISNISKIYEKSKNKTNYKIINTEKKKNSRKILLLVDERNNNTDGNKNISKNNFFDSKSNSTGRKSNKTDNIQNLKYKNISDKKIYNTEKKLESHKHGILDKDIKLSLKEKEIIINNINDTAIDSNKDNIQNLDDSENEVNDTVRCETLKNAYQGIEEDLNESKSISKKFLDNNQNKGRSPNNKNKNQIRLTISKIPLIKQKFKSKEKNQQTKRNLPKVFCHSSTQKNTFVNRDINIGNKGIFENLDYYSFEQNNTKKKENYNLKDEKKNFDNFTNQKIKNKNIINKGNVENNIISNDINDNKQNNNNKYDTIFNDKYNLVNKVKVDNNNNHFQESFLYKNLELYQHSVIFNEDKEKEKIDENENDDKSACILM